MKATAARVCFFVFLWTLGSYISCSDEPAMPKPVADFTFSIPNPGTPPATVVFQSKAQNAESHSWRFTADSSSRSVSPSFNFRRSGTYRVRLTVSNDAGEDTISKEVVVPTLLYYADFTAQVPGVLSLPIEVRFTDQSFGDPIGYFWDFGNGNTNTNRNPTATYDRFGDYTVRQIVTFRDGGIDSVRLTLRFRQ